jgi:hypothetical protein
MDLVLDLVSSNEEVCDFQRGTIEADTDQEEYLNLVGSSFLEYVQPTPPNGWKKMFTEEVSGLEFINQ